MPSSKATKGLQEQIKKIGFLKELGAAQLVLPDLPLAGLEHFSRRVTSRKPAALTRIKDPHRTVEIACFLCLGMLRLTNASLTLLDHRIAALWRGARERADDARESRLRRFHELLGDLAGLAEDEALDAAGLRPRLQALIARFEPERDATQVSAIRQELGRRSPGLVRLLRTARAAALAVPADHQRNEAFAALDALAASSASTLPEGHAQPFGASWQGLIDQPDRAAALGCFRVATLMALKRALRNRSVSVAHSLSLSGARRQAGGVIEGALRQRQVGQIERVAVDTHGFTHFAIALAKVVGFGLCPRLARLKRRRLYLPKGLDIPAVLRPIMTGTVSRCAIGRGWDGWLRLGATVKHGWYPATKALDRFGSAAAGDPVYEAGDELGSLLPHSLFLQFPQQSSVPHGRSGSAARNGCSAMMG